MPNIISPDFLPWFAAAAGAGYLLGSIPFGLVVMRLFGLGDPRKTGSGNIGTANVMRTGGIWPALATLLLDAGKGSVAWLVAFDQGGQDIAVTAALFALLGHVFPVWLLFRGGKAVATFVGIALAMEPMLGLALCALWGGTALLWRYSSLASLVMAALAPAVAWLLVSMDLLDVQRLELVAIMAVVIWARHAGNIRRLFRGEEPKLGARTGNGA